MFLYIPAYDLTALTAEKIAKEAMAVLLDNMVVAGSFFRDFDPLVADYGEVVNFNAPVEGTGRRLPEGTDFTFTTPSATGGSVVMNQQVYAAFSLTSRQKQRSFPDLAEYFIEPHIRPTVQFLEKCCIGEMYNTLILGGGNISGYIGTDPTFAITHQARKHLNERKVAIGQIRPMFVGTDPESYISQIDKFSEARMTGDGSPLITGGVKFGAGFDFALSTLMPDINLAMTDYREGAINSAAGYLAGTTTMTVDGFTGAGVTGQWCTIAGVPYRLTGHTETTGNLTEITIASPGLRDAIVDNAVVRVFDGGTVDLIAGYAAGWDDWIVVADFTNLPQVGQGLQFAATSPIYSVVDVDSSNSKILLNRPLDAAVVNDTIIHLTPAGKYSWSQNRPGQILVNRPLENLNEGSISSFILEYNGIALRTMMSVDHASQKTRISIDALFGLGTYNANYGEIMVS